MKYIKIRFRNGKKATAGLVLTDEKLTGKTIADVSRFFPYFECGKMVRFEQSPAFSDFDSAFLWSFPIEGEII